MTKPKIFAVTFLIVLGACSNRLEEKSREALAGELVSPKEAKFRSVRVIKNGDVCGEVSDRFTDGSYSDYKTFVVSATKSDAAIEKDDMSDLTKQIFFSKCKE